MKIPSTLQRRLACLPVACVFGVFVLSGVSLVSAHARPPMHANPPKMQSVSADELSGISVTRYELALMQVMAEMCPKMLNSSQKTQFDKAYKNQLQSFIPNAKNPATALDYLSRQREYKEVLQSVRTWTSNFPKDENQKLCNEFASQAGQGHKHPRPINLRQR